MKSPIKLQLSAVLICFIFSACNSESSEQNQGMNFGPGGGGGQPTSVEAVPVEASSISDQIRSFGTIRAQDVVNINPQVSNRVTQIHADLGDTVSQGDMLAKIYDVPYQDAYEQAQAQYRQSQSSFQRDSAQFRRQEQLYESDAISSTEFDEARATYNSSLAQLEASEAALTQSREDLENTAIRSPVDGVVMSRSIAEGDIATTGEAAFEIANLVGFEVRLNLPVQDWEEVSVGLPVNLQRSNHQQNIAEGVVSRISPHLNEETGLGEVVVSLIDASSSVRQGMLAESRIILENRENTIVIPRSAMIENVETYIEPETNTVELRRNYFVFVAQGDTVATRKELTLGLEQGERVEVINGLETGEKIIITGQSSLRDGAPIRIAGQQQSDFDQGGEIEMEPSGESESQSSEQ